MPDVHKRWNIQTPTSISRSTYWFAVSGTAGRVDDPGSTLPSSDSLSVESMLIKDTKEGLVGECVGDLCPLEERTSSLPRERPANVLFSDETDDQLGLGTKDGVGKCSLLLECASDRGGEPGPQSDEGVTSLGRNVVEEAKDGEDARVNRLREGAKGCRTRLETTLAYKGGVSGEESWDVCTFWVLFSGSSSGSFLGAGEGKGENSSFMVEWCGDVDVVGVTICSQLSPSGGCTGAFIAEVDARIMNGNMGEVEEGDCASREYTTSDSSRDSSSALASSSSSWSIKSCSRFRASIAESVSARSISVSSDMVSGAIGSGGCENGFVIVSGIDVG